MASVVILSIQVQYRRSNLYNTVGYPQGDRTGIRAGSSWSNRFCSISKHHKRKNCPDIWSGQPAPRKKVGIEVLCHSLPKCNLHCSLDGCLSIWAVSQVSLLPHEPPSAQHLLVAQTKKYLQVYGDCSEGCPRFRQRGNTLELLCHTRV